MNFKTVRIALSTVLLAVSTGVIAQNSNVVSAAIEYKKYMPAMMQNNMDEAKDVIMEAKSFIDPAMEHEDTKNDEKANYYNGVIYFGLVELSSQFEDLEKYQDEETMNKIEASFEIARESRKWKRELEAFVEQRVSQASMFGEQAYNTKNYEMAYQLFSAAHELQGMAGIEDENMRNNAIIAARKQIDTLEQQGEQEKALEVATQASEMFPEELSIAIQGVNIALAEGNLDQADVFFKRATKAAPEDAALYSQMGAVYLTTADKKSRELYDRSQYLKYNADLKDADEKIKKIDAEIEKGNDSDNLKSARERYVEIKKTAEQKLSSLDIDGEVDKENIEKLQKEVESMYESAEKNLKKALELEPKDAGASYNLGRLYLEKGRKLRDQANQMDLSNPNYNKLIEKSEAMYSKAIQPLENYIAQYPNEAAVLRVLSQVYKNSGNSEKAAEYLERAKKAAEAGQ